MTVQADLGLLLVTYKVNFNIEGQECYCEIIALNSMQSLKVIFEGLLVKTTFPLKSSDT